MKLFRIVIPVAVLAFAASQVAAQQATPVGPGPSHSTQHGNRLAVEREILGKLGLSASQKDQVKQLVEKQLAEMKALRQAAKGTQDKAALRARHKELHESYVKSLGSILTASQLKEYKALHKEYFLKNHPKHSGTNPPPR
jgi:hypothetical protein